MTAGALAAGAAVTSTDLLKLAGLAFVFVDHFGLFFDAAEPWWRVLGRAAAPIFFFLIGFARTRAVPWTWLVLGAALTALDLFTSDDWSDVGLNILLNFALIRLALPLVEAQVMPRRERVALLVLACIVLIPVLGRVLEYGSEGWLWALLGLSHRLALENGGWRFARNAIAAVTAAVYVVRETFDLGFEGAEVVGLALLIAGLALVLTRFRRVAYPWRGPVPVASAVNWIGRHSLEIYAVSLFAMQSLAYAWGDAEDDGDDEAA
ncbi:MAG TPA: TraX family protein [Beijerinckiaceae bacterium]|nr:TraX family protein [Beijerinckiaceae bacterium]